MISVSRSLCSSFSADDNAVPQTNGAIIHGLIGHFSTANPGRTGGTEKGATRL
jgi:hypothetical protein